MNSMSIDEINDIERLKKINAALMKRVESSMDQHGNAFSMFQAAIGLEGQVRRRTDELTAALRDMEQVNAELEEAKETSERANLSKTRFLAAASHDVLQPLNAAMLSLSVLADIQETDMGREIAAQIERSLDTMNELLKTLLDISKLDAGTLQPRLETIPILPFLERLKSDFEPIAREGRLYFKIESDPIAVKSDRTMLWRIMQNLVSNAIRYTQSGGVTIEVRQEGETATIAVIDTGIGIEEKFHEQVYEEFHRGALPSGHEREANSGLGLGLSIVQRMAQTLNHQLKLDSTPGRGTTFSFQVPVTQLVVESTPAPDKPVPFNPSNLSGVKLLLIENDPAGVEAGTTLFFNWGCDLRIAACISETIAVLGDTGWVPDIIVADLHLDHGDLGIHAVEEACQHVGRSIPAIVITADPTKESERQIRESGMELLMKPIKPAQLRALISHLLTTQAG